MNGALKRTNTKSCFNTIVILLLPPAPASCLAFTIIYLPKRIWYNLLRTTLGKWAEYLLNTSDTSSAAPQH